MAVVDRRVVPGAALTSLVALALGCLEIPRPDPRRGNVLDFAFRPEAPTRNWDHDAASGIGDRASGAGPLEGAIDEVKRSGYVKTGDEIAASRDHDPGT